MPPVMVLCMDQWQVQWCGYYYLTNGPPSLNIVAVMDFNHRRSNDIWAAIRASSRQSDVLASMHCQNIVNGPWQTGKWMKVLSDGALEVSATCDVNDQLLLKLWPAICREMGRVTAAERGPEGRREYLDQIATMDVLNIKGPKSATSRWFSWNHAHKFSMNERTSRLFVGLHVAVRLCWFRHADEVWDSSSTQPDSSSSSGAAASSSSSGAASASSSGAAASSSSGAAASSSSGSSSAAAAGAQPAGTPKKDSFVNKFHKCLKWMADSDLLFHSDMVYFITKGEADDHSYCTKNVRGRDETLQLHIDWSTWGWLKPLKAALAVLSSPEVLGKLGFVVEFPSAIYGKMNVENGLVSVQDRMATSMATLCVQVIRHRAASMSWYSCMYPALLAALMSTDPAVVQKGFQRFRSDLEAWEAALSSGCAAVEAMAKKSVFNNRYMRACTYFARLGAWRMTPQLRELIEVVWTSNLNEQIVEDANQKIRDDETRASASKSMQHFATWSVPVGAKLLESYQRPEVQISGSIPLPRDSKHDLLFESVIDSDTKEPVDFKSILTASYSTCNSVSLKSAAADMHLLNKMHLANSWAIADHLWQNALISPLMVLCHVPSKTFCFVLEVFDSALLVWPMVSLGHKRPSAK